MIKTSKTKFVLDKKFKKIIDAPEGYVFFTAIHDYVKYIETDKNLSRTFSRHKITRNSDLSNKYNFLMQIYQGVEDVSVKSNEDLGHDRYIAVRDLNRIKNEEKDDNNAFWKKRALFKKLASEVHEKVNSLLA